MNHSHLYSIIIDYIIPVSLILIGLSVLIRKKPIIFDYKFLLLLVAIFFLPLCINIFSRPTDTTGLVLVVLGVLVFLYDVFFNRKGVVVMGADDSDFHKAFISVLTEGNYKFEQTFTSIKILEPLLEISIFFQYRVGSGVLRMMNDENKKAFDKIIAQLKTKEIKANLNMPIRYMAAGVLILFIEFHWW